MHIGQCRFIRDVAGDRGVHRQVHNRLARDPEPIQLALRNLPLCQPLFCCDREGLSSRRDSIDSAAPERLLIVSGQQELLLGRYEVGAIHTEQRLARMNILVRRICEDLANVAGKANLHIGNRSLIHVHVSSRSYVVAYLLVLHGADRHADALHALRRELDGR